MMFSFNATNSPVKKRNDDNILTLNRYDPDIQNIRENTIAETHHLLLETFPKKVKEITDLLNTDHFNYEKFMDKSREGHQLKDLIKVLGIELRQDTIEQTKSRTSSRSRSPLTKSKGSSDTAQKGKTNKNSSKKNDGLQQKVVTNPSTPEKTTDETVEKEKQEEVDEKTDERQEKGVGDGNRHYPVNNNMVEIIELVKPYCRELYEYVQTVRRCITFLTPKMEDGNNTGVAIQEYVTGEVVLICADVTRKMDAVYSYYDARAALLALRRSQPSLEDRKFALMAHDELSFITTRQTLIELRDHYVSLYDLIFKNVDKLRNPRNENVSLMF